MTGAESADAGTLSVAGRIVSHMDPATSRGLGIAAIYQQPSLFPHLTVAENIAMAFETGGAWRRVDWNRGGVEARDLLARIGADIDPDRLVETLSMPEQQLVEIAKALGCDARVLIMDEPTASLPDRGSRDAASRWYAGSARRVSASSTFRTGSTKCSPSPIASRCCATARQLPRSPPMPPTERV